MLKGLHSQEIQQNKKDLQNQPQTIRKWQQGHIYISIITLNINGLHVPTKRHRLTEWIQKQDPYICCLQETHCRPQDTYRLKVRGWKNIFHANGKQRKLQQQSSCQTKQNLNITRDKEGHYILIKGSIQEEDTTIVNIYAPMLGAQIFTIVMSSFKFDPLIILQ